MGEQKMLKVAVCGDTLVRMHHGPSRSHRAAYFARSGRGMRCAASAQARWWTSPLCGAPVRKPHSPAIRPPLLPMRGQPDVFNLYHVQETEAKTDPGGLSFERVANSKGRIQRPGGGEHVEEGQSVRCQHDL